MSTRLDDAGEWTDAANEEQWQDERDHVTASAAACIYCGCTESAACTPPCSWLQLEPLPVCTATPCMEKHETAQRAENVDLANPPIADVEASAPRSACVDCGADLNGKEAIHVGALQWRCAPFCRAPSSPATIGNPTVGQMILEIPLDDIAPDPAQARDEGADDSIGDTLKPTDILPPIELRLHPSEGVATPYMIIDGERRWRGSKKAGRTTIRAWVNPNPGDDGDRLLRQAVLNEGERLKPMEEARTWARIRAAKGWNIQQLAEAVKRPKSTVSDRLALLDAPAPFQKLFADGTLTAAAAPIVREYREVPESVLKAVVKDALESDWSDHVESGVPVPLKMVETGLAEALRYAGNMVSVHNRDLLAGYDGKVITLQGTKWAVDRNAWEKHVSKVRQENHPATSTPPTRREPSEYERKQREAAKKARAEGERRQALIRALGPKLPATLNDEWSMFVIRHLVRELTTDTQRHACRAIGIEPPKVGKLGFEFDKAIVDYAEKKLSAAGRTRTILQLLMAADCYVSPHGADPAKRTAEAAKLAKVDLKKLVAPPAPEKKSKAVKKSAPKSATKRRPVAAFMQPMQPDAILAAVVGDKPIPRTEITKKLWAYIKKNGLQDAKERRTINADEKMKAVFGGKAKASLFDMTKLINKHIKPAKA